MLKSVLDVIKQSCVISFVCKTIICQETSKNGGAISCLATIKLDQKSRMTTILAFSFLNILYIKLPQCLFIVNNTTKQIGQISRSLLPVSEGSRFSPSQYFCARSLRDITDFLRALPNT